MTATDTTTQAARDILAGGLPASWHDRSLALRELLSRLARARARDAQMFARAFLEAPGAVEARNQAARLATAETHLRAELAAADVTAFQLLLKAELGSVWGDTEGIGT